MSLLVDSNKKSPSGKQNKMGLLTEQKPKMGLLVEPPKTTKNSTSNHNQDFNMFSLSNNVKQGKSSKPGTLKSNTKEVNLHQSSQQRNQGTLGSSNSINSIKSVNSILNSKTRVTSHDRLNNEIRNTNNRGDQLSDIMLNRSINQDLKNTSNNLGTSILNYSLNKIQLNSPSVAKGQKSSSNSLKFEEFESKKLNSNMPSLGVNIGGNSVVKNSVFVKPNSVLNLRKDNRKPSTTNSENEFKLNDSKNDSSPFYSQKLIEKRKKLDKDTSNKSDKDYFDFRQKIMVEKSQYNKDNFNNILNEANNYLEKLNFDDDEEKNDKIDNQIAEKLFSRTSLYSVQNYFNPQTNSNSNNNLVNGTNSSVKEIKESYRSGKDTIKDNNYNNYNNVNTGKESLRNDLRNKSEKSDVDKIYQEKLIIDKIIGKVNEREEKKKQTIKSDFSERYSANTNNIKELKDEIKFKLVNEEKASERVSDKKNTVKTERTDRVNEKNSERNVEKQSKDRAPQKPKPIEIKYDSNCENRDIASENRDNKDSRDYRDNRSDNREKIGKPQNQQNQPNYSSNDNVDKLNKIERLLQKIEGLSTKRNELEQKLKTITTNDVSTENKIIINNPTIVSNNNFDSDDCNCEDDVEEVFFKY